MTAGNSGRDPNPRRALLVGNSDGIGLATTTRLLTADVDSLQTDSVGTRPGSR
jgi:hypothetical protein